MKSKLLVTAFLLVLQGILQAQSFVNVQHYGTSFTEMGTAICTDASGNVYTTGYFTDTLQIGPTVLYSQSSDAFVAKYNASGGIIWVRSLSGTEGSKAYAIDVDASGNVYVAGEYSDTLICDAQLISSGGSIELFLLKLNSSGTAQWMRSIGSTASNDRVNGIALDGAGNIYMAGEYSGTCQFGNGVSVTSVNHPVNGASIDGYTAKFNNSGTAQWARSGGGIGTDRTYDIDVDAGGNVFTTGFFSNTATFSGFQLTQNGAVEIFVAGYSTTGTLQLLFKAGSSGYEAGYGIKLDGMGHFYITGLHDGNTLFDTITATPNGSYDMFLAKYTTSGNVVWVRSTLSSQWESGWTVTVDSQGSPYVGATLYHSGTSMFSEVYMTSAGYYDIVLVKYNLHGEFQWATRGGTSHYDEALEIAASDSGKIYGTGYASGLTFNGFTATFGPYTFQTQGSYDMVYFNLRTDITTGQPVQNTFCAGQALTVPFQVHTIAMGNSNVYTAQLSDGQGRFANAVNIGTLATSASSGVINALLPDTLPEGSGYRLRVISSDSARVGSDNGSDITIHSLPAAVITASGNEFCAGSSLPLTANAGPGYTYQWLKAFVPINGAMSQVYNATTSGVFNVIVTNQYGCNRTSSSWSVTKRPYPVATITAAGPTTFCAGGNVQLNATTGTGYTYQWIKGVNNVAGATNPSHVATSGGYYKCRVTSSYGCTKVSNKIKVTILPLPSASITALGPTTFCPGDSVLLQANSGAGFTYQWKKYANFIANATGITYTAKVTGNFKAVVTDSNGCSKTSNGIVVTASCRMMNPDPVTEISAYPNPADEMFTVQIAGKSDLYRISLVNLSGQQLIDTEAVTFDGETTIDIPVDHLPPGMYFLQVQSALESKTLKMVVQ